MDSSKPYDFSADIHSGETHAVVKGQITQPFHLDRFTAQVDVNGPTLSDLYFLTGLALPSTPAYHLTMAVERNQTNYRLNDINAVLGNSDLHGNLTVDTSQKVPALAGKMASRVLDACRSGAGDPRRPARGRQQLSLAGRPNAHRAAAPDQCGGGL